MTSKVDNINNNYRYKDKQSRLDFSMEKIKEYRNKERSGIINIPLDESLSIEEMVCIEQSYFEIHEEIECESGCEHCDRFCTNQCIKFLIHGNIGDEWSEGILSSENEDGEVETIDDYLENKRHEELYKY